MSDFASATSNVNEISDKDWSLGFGGCGSEGIEAVSANLNGVIQRLCESFVQSVTDDENGCVSVDNTDPVKPVIRFDKDALATALCGDEDFVTCIADAVLGSNALQCAIAEKVLTAFSTDPDTGVATFASNVDDDCEFTHEPCA
jgi:hypothetical protein